MRGFHCVINYISFFWHINVKITITSNSKYGIYLLSYKQLRKLLILLVYFIPIVFDLALSIERHQYSNNYLLLSKRPGVCLCCRPQACLMDIVSISLIIYHRNLAEIAFLGVVSFYLLLLFIHFTFFSQKKFLASQQRYFFDVYAEMVATINKSWKKNRQCVCFESEYNLGS